MKPTILLQKWKRNFLTHGVSCGIFKTFAAKNILEMASRLLIASVILELLNEDSLVNMNACCSGIQVVSTVRLSVTKLLSPVCTTSKMRECTKLMGKICGKTLEKAAKKKYKLTIPLQLIHPRFSFSSI